MRPSRVVFTETSLIGKLRRYGANDSARLLPLSPLTSMPNFLHAATIRAFTSDRVTPLSGYMAAFFGIEIYARAARACASVSMGYLPFFGSAYFTSP